MINNRNYYLSYILSVLLALLVGGLSGVISGVSMMQYGEIIKPPLSPPGWLFPIVWTVLYILMGIAAAKVWSSGHKERDTALAIYAVQLAVNFLWPIFYFTFEARLLALLWLALLVYLVFIAIKQFNDISKTAAWLLLPYFVWLLYAAYLNFGSYLLNR